MLSDLSLGPLTLQDVGWVVGREIAPAWYGGAPSFVALCVRLSILAHPGVRGRDPSRLKARGGLAGL